MSSIVTSMNNELLVIGASGVINNLGNIDHVTNFIRLRTVGGIISLKKEYNIKTT